MDQRLIQIENDSYPIIFARGQFDDFMGLFRDGGIGKGLEGRNRIDEVVEMGIHVLSIVNKFINTLFHLWNIVVYLFDLCNRNRMRFVPLRRLATRVLDHSFQQITSIFSDETSLRNSVLSLLYVVTVHFSVSEGCHLCPLLVNSMPTTIIFFEFQQRPSIPMEKFVTRTMLKIVDFFTDIFLVLIELKRSLCLNAGLYYIDRPHSALIILYATFVLRLYFSWEGYFASCPTLVRCNFFNWLFLGVWDKER